ncbi:MAG TPA: T9SS type A sorting domain-containing protein [Balneolales bacterium]|nr:T9SS type A sorting domain-containing protein [Balneolales bacterium]
MKHLNYKLLLLALSVGVVFYPAKLIMAQQGDTLTVEWQNTDQTVKVNALRDAIAADTTATGERAHKVYKLKKGGFYWITDPIQNDNFPLIIVGENADPTDIYGNPPVIQRVTRNDGTAPSDRMFTVVDDATFKKVWIVGADDNGVQTAYQPVTITGNDKTYIFDNVIFERSNFAITAFTGTNNDIHFTNCKFRNLIGSPSTQQWEGRGISVWASQDTIIIENNTFFNIGYTAFQLEGGYRKYIRFNHNTIVNNGRQIEDLNKKQEYFTNNLILNGFWHGEGNADLTAPGRDPGQYSTGFFTVGILPSQYGLEVERQIVLANNALWRDPQFNAYYADSIHVQPLVSDTSRYFFSTYDHIIAQDTMWLSSAPSGMTSDAFTGAVVDSMWNNITDLRRGITPAQTYFYKLTDQATAVSWPLPENFAYTDATLMQAGTDKLPLGDLNWFPQSKQTFETNKATYIKAIEDLGGTAPAYDIKSTIEAESGMLSGDAKVDTVQGTAFYTMKSGGFIKWTFNLSSAGTYGLKIKTRANDATRGEYIYINGSSMSITKGDDGGYLFKGLTYPAWQWYTITKDTLTTETAGQLDFVQGENTIEIKPEWGYQDFSDVALFSGGDPNNVVMNLTAPMAVVEQVEPGVEDAGGQAVDNVPSGFMSVELGANGGTGSIELNIDSLADGSYLARIFYLSPDGSQTGQISVNGTVADPSVNFAASTSMTSVATKLFMIKNGQVTTLAGTQSTFTLSSSGHIIVDYLQLAQQVTSIESGRGQLPTGFSLEQNYPNPFNPTTTIRFKLPQASNVQLTVYNVLGQKVAVLVNNHLSAGTHLVQFNAKALASGLYFYQLKAGNFVMNKKMMLIK